MVDHDMRTTGFLEFIIVVVLMLIFAVEYPVYSGVVEVLIFVFLIFFILDFLSGVLNRLERVIKIDASGIRIKKRRYHEEG